MHYLSFIIEYLETFGPLFALLFAAVHFRIL